MRNERHPDQFPASPDDFPAPADRRATHVPRTTLRSVLNYKICEQGTEWLLYFSLVFGPWAFGTTQPWSIWTLNVTGYLLGALLVWKWSIRRFQGHRPPRWEGEAAIATRTQPIIAALFALTALILLYCLVSALNARAIWQPELQHFDYRGFISWLPHSYDQPRTWQYFANYLALACWFWAARDWLLGKTESEIRAARADTTSTKPTALLPERLRRLLWVVSLNGLLLGVEGIIQRISNTNKLLWLVGTRENREAQFQFGPYAYRSNAAQYFNLLWPVTLAFWWALRRELRRDSKATKLVRRSGQHVLLVAVLIMAVCPVISTSRASAIVTLGCLVLAATIVVLGMRRRHPLTRFAVVLFCLATAACGLWFGGEKLDERMKELDEGFRVREMTYDTARQIAREHPLFGTGPGTFEPLFQFYRVSPDEYWPAYLHNDWLETLVTFGWLGSALIALASGVVLARWFAGGGVPASWRFTSLLWLALGGCLLQARFDFPMQVYSILMVFLLVAVILSVVGRRAARSD